ncbi:MAG: DUF4870 domain-containing protein [Tepidisphaera sp.]
MSIPHASQDSLIPTQEWERNHALWTQLSLVLAFVPGVGTVLAIGATLLLWLMKRDTSRFVDDHGREVMNFQISFLIYSIVCFPLYFILIGIPIILAVYIAAVVGLIRGAVAAHRGDVFRYPICLRFIR